MTESWPTAPRPTKAVVDRRRRLVEAIAAGDDSGVAAHLDDTDPGVRSSAILGTHRLGGLGPDLAQGLLGDESALVRRTLAEIAAEDTDVDLAALIHDKDSSVAEAACWAAGERGERARQLVPVLAQTVRSHDDALCRESAVAALGAIGNTDGLEAILDALKDKATVRRRAVLALAPFDSPAVDDALRTALADRDWQVRQAAEDLLDQ